MSRHLCMSSPDGRHAFEADDRCHFCPERAWSPIGDGQSRSDVADDGDQGDTETIGPDMVDGW